MPKRTKQAALPECGLHCMYWSHRYLELPHKHFSVGHAPSPLMRLGLVNTATAVQMLPLKHQLEHMRANWAIAFTGGALRS